MLTTANPLPFPTERDLFSLDGYKNLDDLYKKRADLVTQSYQIKQSINKVMTELSNTEVTPDIDGILSGKISINQLKSDKLLKTQNNLNEELTELKLKASVLTRASDKLEVEISGLESQGKSLYQGQAVNMINDHVENIKNLLDQLWVEHKSIASIQQSLRAEVGLTLFGNAYFPGFSARELKVAKHRISEWYRKAKLEG